MSSGPMTRRYPPGPDSSSDCPPSALRSLDTSDLSGNQHGMGRELFSLFRNAVGTAEEGGATFGLPPIFEKEKVTV